MARLQINYPAFGLPGPQAESPTTEAPQYQNMPTKSYQPKLFGFLPWGSARTDALYDTNDPAVRALYGLDDPNRNKASAPAASAPMMLPPGGNNYGVNDTGRTYPYNPNPSYSNNTTVPMSAPTYPAGSGGGGSTSSAADPFGGFLGGLLGLLTGRKPQQSGAYEPALRERPEDIQALVSMTRMPPEMRGKNAGGFLGGMFDDKG